MARPQFTMQQRNFLVFEYHKNKGTRDFKDQILSNFQAKFPGVRQPSTTRWPTCVLRFDIQKEDSQVDLSL